MSYFTFPVSSLSEGCLPQLTFTAFWQVSHKLLTQEGSKSGAVYVWLHQKDWYNQKRTEGMLQPHSGKIEKSGKGNTPH